MGCRQWGRADEPSCAPEGRRSVIAVGVTKRTEEDACRNSPHMSDPFDLSMQVL